MLSASRTVCTTLEPDTPNGAGEARSVGVSGRPLFTAGAAKAAGPLPEILQPQNDVSLVAAIGYIYVSAYGLAALLMAAIGLSAGALIGYYRRPRVS